MLEVLCPSHSTKTTIWAMVWLFVIRHPKVTNITVVIAELNPTVYAMVGFTGLPRIAFPTNNFLYRKAINGVVCFLLRIHRGETTGKR